jgi:5-amino-6-(5-phosphoribosylamino)uracil reductase
MDQGLVDEIYLTLCPVVIGGRRSPTPVDGTGFVPGRFPNFRLREMRRVGHELFLHYRRTGARPTLIPGRPAP